MSITQKWCDKRQLKLRINPLKSLQRLACLSITGAMGTAPTAELETLLSITP